MIDEYFRELQTLIAAFPFVTAVSLHTERRSETIGFVRGDLTFQDGSLLHFREYVRVGENIPVERFTYVYHYQSVEGQRLFRYDNTNHYPGLTGAPHHKHMGENNVASSQAPDLQIVLKEIGSIFIS